MKTPLLPPARKAELLARYPAEDTVALADAFGLTARQVRNLASNNRAPKAVGDARTSDETYSRQVHAAVAAAGKAGLSRAEAIAALPDLREHGVCNTLRTLAYRELLFRAGPRGRSRWFAVAAHADEHQARVMTTSRQEVDTSLRAPVSVGAWPRGPAHQPGEAVVPAGMEPVRGPSPATAPPPQPEPGLFKTLGPGRYVDMQPKNWVGAVTSKDQREDRAQTHSKAA